MPVVVSSLFVTGMGMVMRTMVARVVMLVHHGIPVMVVFVLVLMEVLMAVDMGVLMGMRFPSMRMLVGMDVGMVMSMNMVMFVIAVHDSAPFVCIRLRKSTLHLLR